LTRLSVQADGEEAREKRKKGTGESHAQSTLEANLGNITSQRVDKEFDVDPLFRKILGGADDGGSKGLLLNTLGVHAGCNLVGGRAAQTS
jgi:condensin complex subunit 2